MVARVLTACRTLIYKLKRRAKQTGISVGWREPFTPPDTFCVLAFNHLHLTPNGTAKMCCIAGEEISKGGAPLSLNCNSYEEIWNSEYMLSARRGMAKGERISACARCYHEEHTVGSSRRTYMNGHWLPQIGKTPAEIAAAAKREAWRVASRPAFLQLNLGNLCNLACRMCTSEYSSRISGDPVQSKWIPEGFMAVARWVGLKLHIGPRPLFGVRTSGFYDYEAHPDHPLRWTNGHGVICFSRPRAASLEKLLLQLKGSRVARLRVLLNGIKLFDGEIGLEPKTLELDISRYLTETDFKIELLSEPTVSTGRSKRLGVAVLDACVKREAPKPGISIKNDRVFTRFEGDGGWWSQKEVLFGEILSDPTECRRIIFQGGEPLLIKEVEEIFDFLIRNEAAQKVVIELTTNMTTVSDSVIKKLRCFRSVDVGCSIDGIGAVYEYIRFPARWSEVEPNIKKFLGENMHVVFNVAVQAYNLMAITEIYRYADKAKIDVAAHFLVGPDYLSVLVLPRTARRIAMKRIQSYLDGEDGATPSSNNRASAEYLLHFLKQHYDIHHLDRVRLFMVFTNDMDISRHQSFLETYPELAQLFREDGLNWIEETRYTSAAHCSAA